VEIYHQTMIPPMLLDDSKTIMQCRLLPYSMIHLHIRLRGSMPNYLDIPAEIDRDDISTYDNGLSFSNSAPILINADTRSYSGSIVSSIPWNISHVADPVKDVYDIYDYRGMNVSTSPPRSVISSYHVDLTSTPGPDNEYISIHRLNDYSINKLNNIRITLMIHLPNRSSVVVNVKFGDKIIDLKIKIF